MLSSASAALQLSTDWSASEESLARAALYKGSIDKRSY